MRAQWRYTVTIFASFESWICRVRGSEVDATNDKAGYSFVLQPALRSKKRNPAIFRSAGFR